MKYDEELDARKLLRPVRPSFRPTTDSLSTPPRLRNSALITKKVDFAPSLSRCSAYLKTGQSCRIRLPNDWINRITLPQNFSNSFGRSTFVKISANCRTKSCQDFSELQQMWI